MLEDRKVLAPMFVGWAGCGGWDWLICWWIGIGMYYLVQFLSSVFLVFCVLYISVYHCSAVARNE